VPTSRATAAPFASGATNARTPSPARVDPGRELVAHRPLGLHLVDDLGLGGAQRGRVSVDVGAQRARCCSVVATGHRVVRAPHELELTVLDHALVPTQLFDVGLHRLQLLRQLISPEYMRPSTLSPCRRASEASSSSCCSSRATLSRSGAGRDEARVDHGSCGLGRVQRFALRQGVVTVQQSLERVSCSWRVSSTSSSLVTSCRSVGGRLRPGLGGSSPGRRGLASSFASFVSLFLVHVFVGIVNLRIDLVDRLVGVLSGWSLVLFGFPISLLLAQ